MKRLSLFILIFFLCSCQTLPVINYPVSSSEKNTLICPHPFLKEKYRLVHAIEFRMAGSTRGTIIGITLADPFTRSVSCAVMTAEGMVLFDAEVGPSGLQINRALPPFDSRDFAENMIEDIKLIFLAPSGEMQAKGFLPGGAKACRYLQENGDWIDVIENESAGTEIKRYSSSGALKRHVLFSKTAKNIYQNIELQANETFDYSLLLNLIEAQPVKVKIFKRK